LIALITAFGAISRLGDAGAELRVASMLVARIVVERVTAHGHERTIFKVEFLEIAPKLALATSRIR
jgi:hypothetical protein